MSSGALMRHDQEARGHYRLKGKLATHIGDESGGGPRAIGRFGEFGTIGAKLTRPER